MRSTPRALCLALAGLVLAEVGDGLAVGSDHACVVLDDGSMKVSGVGTATSRQEREGRKARVRSIFHAATHSLTGMFCLTRPVLLLLLLLVVVLLPVSRTRFGVGLFLWSDVVPFTPAPYPQCFGKNDYGQLGQGDVLARGDTTSGMGDSLGTVDLGGSGTTRVVAMSAGSDHTCAILSGGELKVRQHL